MQTSRSITFIAVFAILLGSAAGLFFPHQVALGQASARPWSDPINLSNSGGATHPVMMIDSKGKFHVLWEDVYAQFVYTHSDDGQTWADPVVLNLPFYGLPYQLLADNSRDIFALWLDETGRLWESHVDANSFGDSASWSSPNILAYNAVRFDAVFDKAQRIHLAYMQVANTNEAPSGIYYMLSGTYGQGWSTARAVYQSKYLRNLQNNLANARSSVFDLLLPARVDIEITEVDGSAQLFLTWDNPILKRVFFSRSSDNGRTWEEATLVEGPTLEFPYLNPSTVHLNAQGSTIMLVWNNDDSASSCTHRFQYSTDGGSTWTAPADLLPDVQVCLTSYQLMNLPNGEMLLFGSTSNQTDLLVWNGVDWSSLQEQNSLMNLVDPQSFTFVQPGCQSANLVDATLWMVDCDQASGGDIWISHRAIDNTQDFFPNTQRWARLVSQELDPVAIKSLTAIAQPDGSTFAFWSEPDQTATEKIKTHIYLARWSGADFSGVYPVIEGLPGVANQLSLVDGNNQRLFIAWSGSEAGQVQVSWANLDQASNPSGWSAPKPLQQGSSIGWYPSLEVDPSGELVLVFAAPFNEQRGVYLMKSADGGQNWSDPVVVFDAAANDCAMVDQPHLAITTDRQYSLQWTCSTVPGGIGPHDLYSTHSSDGGATWTPAEAISSQPIYWDALTAYGSTVHRLWKEVHGVQTLLFYSLSTDSGKSWSTPENFWATSSPTGLTNLVEDHGGQLHLVQAIQEESDTPKLLYFRLESGKWVPDETLDLGVAQMDEVIGLALVMDTSNRLIVVAATDGPADSSGQKPNLLTFYSKPIQVPEGEVSQPVVSISPQAVPTLTETATQDLAAPTVMPTLASGVLGNPDSSGNNSTMGLVIGSAIALIIIAGVMTFNIIQSRREKF